MVYVINAQDCYNSFGEIGKVRNRLFTAMTRSKAWVRVVGHGAEMTALQKEYKKVEKENYKMNFIYPNKDLRDRLRIVNRHMLADEKNHIKSVNRSMSTLLQKLSRDDVQLEDFSKTTIEALRKRLGG